MPGRIFLLRLHNGFIFVLRINNQMEQFSFFSGFRHVKKLDFVSHSGYHLHDLFFNDTG